jgi:hypothetical protein
VMKAGQGYWIYMTAAATLTYPATGGVATANAVMAGIGQGFKLPEPHFATREDLQRQAERLAPVRRAESEAGVLPTSTWVDFGGTATQPDGAPYPAGTVLHAVDPDGTVCGATIVLEGGAYGPLACYADIEDTKTDEGAKAGDLIRIVAGEQEVDTGLWSGPLTYHQLPESKIPNPNEGETRLFYLPIIVR